MTLSDTSTAARDVYLRRLAEMTPSERVSIGAALWAAGDSVQRAAMLAAYPNADNAEINFRIAVTRFGAELASRVPKAMMSAAEAFTPRARRSSEVVFVMQ